ncbi:MAG: shikimate kinase [Elusimicrobia bacterium]|nr:shikimate kinase [Elusimicrobiota bacterium]
MRISLIGFTGVGKTQIGRVLADRLGSAFFDVDGAIENRTGQSVTELLGKYGVEEFRNLETQVIADLTEKNGSCVIATGGGTLNRPANRTRLKKATRAVWLKAKPETIWHRIQDKPYVAPLFFTRQDPLMAIRAEMSRREPQYEEVAEFAVEIDGKEPEEVAENIEKALTTKEGALPK